MNEQNTPVHSEQSVAGTPATPASEPTPNPSDILGPVRLPLASVAVGVVLISLAFSAFVLKQNRNISFAMRVRDQQIQQIGDALKKWTPVLNELAGYSLNNPELSSIFARHGLQISPPASSTKP